ncbi:lipid IV(A) 3-deoxy-D-manno-octulosonic acid transferase [Methyloversatilis discipulorum]|uniref:lipid IV(A) 3-deoxy-D-manno-octulosonic acid transferase n=1 Tax=Methyloversatilis discipulorum TaxID=1119528 RepID=UPI001A459C7F|nr:lipid IV(A) 3-deoxy-D-manno-octulosonic acid transferase [Methyloversatilis discipulorum]MBL8470077.1 lipid IV(A) 3-deoxy-D-manno-octulosonic acid transferase [Methyloversatilis discipulorum]
MMRALYTLIWLLGLPIALLRTRLRGQREPGYLEDIGGRLGLGPHPPSRPTLWLHAVSVGETRAAAPLLAALRARYPEHRLLITQMTATGRATARALYGDFAEFAWLPWDLPWAQRAFLRRWRPALGIVMETEIWPNLVHECRRAGVPVVLANARMSARSATRYARLGGFVSTVLRDFSALVAQTAEDAVRLSALGAPRVAVAGNLKFDIEPPASQLDLGRAWRAGVGPRRVLLLASTREDEEAPLLDALLPELPSDVLIALVPRHPQRFDEVADDILSRGLTLCRRSSGASPDTNTRIWLGDAMGEMFAWYALADLALIGGSWQPLGGQNLIEACAVGCPVVIGPHTFNFSTATLDAIGAGAAMRAIDEANAAAIAHALLDDPERRQRMATAAHTFARAHRGATVRTLQALEALLPSSGND